jgi:lysophospholipase L1-like esterase
MKAFHIFFLLLLLTLLAPISVRAEADGKIQILLLGDSTTEAKFPKLLAPKEPQFEDIIRILLAAEGDLPPTNVINSGVSGETIRRLIDSGRYEKQASKLPGLDYIFIRYGLNDQAKIPNFEVNFPKDFHELLAKLRTDHPHATLIPMTVIPFADEATSAKINGLVRQIAEEEKLTLFDIYPRYAEELKHGPDMLNYRRFPLEKIPEKLREFAKAYATEGKDPAVVVLDNRLDSHFGNLPGWYRDRHPNLAGYHVIADETVKYLAPLIRAKAHAAH